VAAQFTILGTISVALNTSVDLIVTYWAAQAREWLAERPKFIARTRQASGAVMCGLGAALLIVRRTS
jgi:threonine/homoserine/homoserine lactone efflux protein